MYTYVCTAEINITPYLFSIFFSASMLRTLIKLSAALSFLLLLNGAYFEYVINRDIVPAALALLALFVVLMIDAMVGYYLLKLIVKLLKIKSE